MDPPFIDEGTSPRGGRTHPSCSMGPPMMREGSPLPPPWTRPSCDMDHPLHARPCVQIVSGMGSSLANLERTDGERTLPPEGNDPYGAYRKLLSHPRVVEYLKE